MKKTAATRAAQDEAGGLANGINESGYDIDELPEVADRAVLRVREDTALIYSMLCSIHDQNVRTRRAIWIATALLVLAILITF